MKRIQYHRYGGPEVMRLEDFDSAQPGAGEVLVRVRAAAANPMDFVIRAGRMKFVTGRRFPRAMGYDFASADRPHRPALASHPGAHRTRAGRRGQARQAVITPG
ncbi:alcohol dehydrogenase catalytic domain-containing protein [Streptomyces sp. NPDC058464]|uniref:alcohol dehydrogenase catalytic domain-containing protein n=1 Tax=Streptomyces sp. NPDC058464 TaxID=3346511 RepID=UPI003646E8CA